MNSYLFGQRSKVCGPSKVNIFNQLVKRLTCFQLGNVDGLNQILVLKYIFFIPLHGDDFFMRSHSERTILLPCFKLLLLLLHLAINKKNIYICELIYTIRLLFYE